MSKKTVELEPGTMAFVTTEGVLLTADISSYVLVQESDGKWSFQLGVSEAPALVLSDADAEAALAKLPPTKLISAHFGSERIA